MPIINGTIGKDNPLSGTVGNDSIYGFAGDDRIITNDGDDYVEAGDGDDEVNGYPTTGTAYTFYASTGSKTIYGGNGNDFLVGSSGNNLIYGDSDNDRIYGQDANDKLFGGEGNDTIYGGAGIDTLDGENGDDFLTKYKETGVGNFFGGNGNDTLDGGEGVDELKGYGGNDTYYVRDAYDFIYDTAGIDTAYVSASFVKIPSTIENVIYTDGALALPYWIDALLPNEAAGLYFKSLLSGTTSFNYAFPKSLPTYDKNASHADGFTTFTTEQIYRTKEALSYITSLVNLQFIETIDANQTNTLIFANNNQTGSGGYAQMPNDDFSGSDVFLNKTSKTTFSLADGQYQTLALIHEIGHALGLEHPFSTPSASGTFADPPSLTGTEDTTQWTVMSYTDAPEQYFLRFSPLDIAALQYVYGPSKSARTGDDSYFVSNLEPNFIWDGAGTDTIDASKLTTGATIFLTPGYWGFVGSNKATLITIPGQITVNFGTSIENLVGSNYADKLLGNELGNDINGGAGDDEIYGLSGDDSLNGGSGNDNLFGGC